MEPDPIDAEAQTPLTLVCSRYLYLMPWECILGDIGVDTVRSISVTALALNRSTALFEGTDSPKKQENEVERDVDSGVGGGGSSDDDSLSPTPPNLKARSTTALSTEQKKGRRPLDGNA